MVKNARGRPGMFAASGRRCPSKDGTKPSSSVPLENARGSVKPQIGNPGNCQQPQFSFVIMGAFVNATVRNGKLRSQRPRGFSADGSQRPAPSFSDIFNSRVIPAINFPATCRFRSPSIQAPIRRRTNFVWLNPFEMSFLSVKESPYADRKTCRRSTPRKSQSSALYVIGPWARSAPHPHKSSARLRAASFVIAAIGINRANAVDA